jgi:hypothetical protein
MQRFDHNLRKVGHTLHLQVRQCRRHAALVDVNIRNDRHSPPRCRLLSTGHGKTSNCVFRMVYAACTVPANAVVGLRRSSFKLGEKCDTARRWMPGTNEDVAPDKVRSASVRMARMDSSHQGTKRGEGELGLKGVEL